MNKKEALKENRVVVTGLGAVTPIGLSVERLWVACQRGENGIGLITRFDTTSFPCKIAGELKGFDPTNYMDRKEVKRTDRYTHYAIAAAEEALNDSNLLLFEKLDCNQVGVIIASGIGGIETIAEEHQSIISGGVGRISPFFAPKMIINIASGRVAIQHGFRGPNFSLVSACASANHAIGESYHIIRRGDACAIVTGGAEATITLLGMAGFTKMKALSTRNDKPDQASRPFDLGRDGFVMGEGAGIVILENLEHALERGARIYAEVCGYGSSSDAYHITAPDPKGEGAVLSMQRAIDRAGISPADVGYINAHGTSTPYNDRIETLAIKRVFGDWAPYVPISSTKSMTGHLLGASGGVEMIVTVLSIADGILHPTRNYEVPDPECDLDYIPDNARSCRIKYALSNAFGFGGHTASIVVGKFSD